MFFPRFALGIQRLRLLAMTADSGRKALCLGLLLILLAITVQSIRIGISGLIVELGQREVDRWTVSSRPRGMREISRVARYFTDSLDYVPDNPWALEALGALDLARMRLSGTPRQALAYSWAARLRFLRALRERPASPFLWANLALAKLYLDEIDTEFLTAMRNADALGPWEPRSQQTVVFVGLASWDKLEPMDRQRILGGLERGAVWNSAKMLEIVKSFGRFDLICDGKVYDVKRIAGCRDLIPSKAPVGAEK